MKKNTFVVLSFALVAIFALVSCAHSASTKILLAGSGSDSIAVLDRDSKTIEWSYAIPENGECNSAVVTKQGNVLFSYRSGARLIDFDNNTLWDFPREEETQEIQSAIQTPYGCYMLSVCGHPAKFIFLDSEGKKISETAYETGIEHPHGQFRQCRIAKNGNILIPVMSTGDVVELSSDGNVVKQFNAGAGLFSLEELDGGNLLVSGEFGVAEFDRENGNLIKQIVKDSLPGVKFAFCTQSTRMENGHTVLTNWQGHVSDRGQALIVEIDSDDQEVWVYESSNTVKLLSSAYYFEK